MHENGYLTVYNDAITEKDIGSNLMMFTPSVVVDVGTGSVLKFGDSITSDIQIWYDKVISAYRSVGLDELADSLRLITFDKSYGVLDIDDICTLINYMRNSLGAKEMSRVLSLSEVSLKEEIKRLQDLGF